MEWFGFKNQNYIGYLRHRRSVFVFTIVKHQSNNFLLEIRAFDSSIAPVNAIGVQLFQILKNTQEFIKNCIFDEYSQVDIRVG